MVKKFFLLVAIFIAPLSLMAMDATFYSDSFEGGWTANGDTFSQSNHTAAICAETLGQLVYVSRGNTGMTVFANDRPNCKKYPNLIDLTSSAFLRFAPLSAGRISDVSVQPLGINTGKIIKRDLSQQVFSSLGIELMRPISNTYIAGESITLAGRVSTWDKYVMTYLEDKRSGKKYSQSYPVNTNGSFRIVLSLPADSGEYYFIVAAGTSFRTEEPVSVFLVDPTSLLSAGSTWGLQNRFVLRPQSTDQWVILPLPEHLWWTLQLQTSSQTLDIFGQTLSVDGLNIPRGQATYIFTGYTLSSPSSLDRSPTPTHVSSGQVLLDEEHSTTGSDRVRFTKQTQSFTFRFRIPPNERILATYYVTLPSGDVRSYDFPSKYVDGTTGLLRTGVLIQSSFPSMETGTYKVEVNGSDGFAYFNVPMIRGNVWNIVAPLSDADIRNKKISPQIVRTNTLSAINILRARMGRADLMMDATLTELAQKKADDMAQYDYVWHTSHDGNTIRAFGDSLGINITSALGENVAGGNVSGKALQLGLEESGSHRANMIDPDWKKVGIGYVVSGDKTYMVQVFSE